MDKVADELNIKVEKEKLLGLVGDANIAGEKVLLVKPLTYMNLSGNCVQEILNFYKASSEDLIVIYDDIDIEVGKIRVKPSGSPGTHNGMRDITSKIGSTNFIRVRIGSGRPQNGQDLADYVLGGFRKEEVSEIDKAVTSGADAVLEVLKNGIQSAMNKFN